MVQAGLILISYWLITILWMSAGGGPEAVWLGLLPAVWLGALFLLYD